MDLIKLSLDLDSKAFAVMSIPHAWSLAYLPHLYSLYLAIKAIRKKQAKMIDYACPRPGYDAVGNVTTPLARSYAKARGAHINGLEQLTMHAASIIIALYAGLPTRSINNSAALYLASRALYNWLYLFTKAGPLRTAAWSVGPCLQMLLLIRSAIALA